MQGIFGSLFGAFSPRVRCMSDPSLTRYLADQGGDLDPSETAEWRDAFLALVATHGPARARFILDQLAILARSPLVGWSPELVTPYVNTVSVERRSR